MKIKKNRAFKFLICLMAGFICFVSCKPVLAYDDEAVNYNSIGINYTKKGSFDQAINYFKKAIETDPSLTNAYYNLGSLYKHTGNKDKAINAFQLLLRNNPNDDEAAYMLAGMYFEKQDYEKALVYLNSIEKTSLFYKDSLELFKKINQKINDTVINEPSKQINVSKLTFTGFDGPAGIAEDSKGDLYVVNYVSNSVNVISPDGKLKSVIKNELIKGPVGIAIDSKDNVYIANNTSNTVIKVDKNGAVKVVFKDAIKPYYLFINKSDVLYVSEQDKNTVIRIGITE